MIVNLKSLRSHDEPHAHKLAAVKAMKKLTGYGLKEAKDIIDRLYDTPGYSYRVKLESYDADSIEVLKEVKIVISDGREDTIDNVLTNILVRIPSDDIEYRVFDGTYEIEGNRLIIYVNDGKYVSTKEINIELSQKDLNSTKVTLDFSKCIIEEAID